MNMNSINPVLISPKTDIPGNDHPTKVRAFKAVQISTLPSIPGAALASTGSLSPARHEQSTSKGLISKKPFHRKLAKEAGTSKTSRAAGLLLNEQSAFSLPPSKLSKDLNTANSNQEMKLPSPSKRGCTKGVMGYADELFEMRLQ